MSVFYFMGGFGCGELSKKILSCGTGFPAYEYEHTYHLVRLNNSHYSKTHALSAVWVFVVIAPYWEERGG